MKDKGSGSGNHRKLFHLLWWESIFATAFDTWIHPTFLSGLAGELKIPLGIVSVIAAIPWIGATGQIVGAWAFERSHSVKVYVLGVASLGRALWIFPLLLAAWWGYGSYFLRHPFPVIQWFIWLALSACCSSLLANASANAWMYWMRNLIPSRLQGRFFGTRQQFTTSAFLIGSVIAAYLVGWIPQGYRVGSALLGAFALISGTISIFLHSRVRDFPILRSVEHSRRSLIKILKEPVLDPDFREFLFFGAAFNGVIQLCGSYYPYYFTKELHIPMSTIAFWIGITNLGSFCASNYWGKKVDQSRNLPDILWTTGHVVAFTPLLYFFFNQKGLIQTIAPIEYFLSGLAWSGFALAQTKLLFQLSPPNEGATYFSVYAVVCGLSGAICTFLGGQIAQFFAPWGGFRVLWLLGSVARLGVLRALCKPLIQNSSFSFAKLLKKDLLPLETDIL